MRSNIRNFCIISHIDHGKSTLADRLLEITGTVEKRKMKEQFLDMHPLERERGITIKMQPVRMLWRPSQRSEIRKKSQIQNPKFKTGFEFQNADFEFTDSEYILNLIDTPGHIDFSYEVSRALAAVEGAILLVDASRGVQAQTIANVELAREQKLKIIPVLNKIDLEQARIKETEKEVALLLACRPEEIIKISAKTGQGIETLLEAILQRIPAPNIDWPKTFQALIFDSEFSPHQGVIAYIKIVNGELKAEQNLRLIRAGINLTAGEIGIFTPERKKTNVLKSGEIGYVATNIKNPGTVKVGDTICNVSNPQPALPGYKEPTPMVWSNLYPVSQDDFDLLKKALERLHLIDASFTYEEESLGALGRSFNCGFLGMLHVEIITERIKREFGINIVVSQPTARYEVTLKDGKKTNIHSPASFPEDHQISEVDEPWLKANIIAPADQVNRIFALPEEYEMNVLASENFSASRINTTIEIPLRELMRDFYDRLKSATSGYASLDYEPLEYRKAKVARLDVLVHGERIPAFSRIVSEKRIEREARQIVEKLKNIIPKELFSFKIQASAHGRIVASEQVNALKKDVTGYLYGGDRTRKMKLWQKQKKGKKKLKSAGAVEIPHEIYVKMLKSG